VFGFDYDYKYPFCGFGLEKIRQANILI